MLSSNYVKNFTSTCAHQSREVLRVYIPHLTGFMSMFGIWSKLFVLLFWHQGIQILGLQNSIFLKLCQQKSMYHLQFLVIIQETGYFSDKFPSFWQFFITFSEISLFLAKVSCFRRKFIIVVQIHSFLLQISFQIYRKKALQRNIKGTVSQV
jgi:hypothetical protein